MTRVWILGASDPEMELIEKLLRARGETVVHAIDSRGERVRGGTAYRGARAEIPADAKRVYLVECDVPTPEGVERVIVDHHRPGDPGYGRPPKDFMAASSIGQVIAELARLGRLPMGQCVSTYEWVGDWEARQRAASRWFCWASEARTPFGGGALFESFRAPYRIAPCDGYYIVVRYKSGVVEFTSSPDEMREEGAIRVAPDKIVRVHIPHEIVLAAAADHCLGAAYRGECPGVDPDELMKWRAESRARFQKRGVDDVLADIERARQALRKAPDLALEVTPGDHCGDGRRCDCREGGYGYGGWTSTGTGDCYCDCDGCQRGDYYITARDMRGRHVPELPEAAAREGICFVADGLPDPDGRVKIVCQNGTPRQIEAFEAWAQSQRMIDFYGDPARGIAGAYKVAAPAAKA